MSAYHESRMAEPCAAPVRIRRVRIPSPLGSIAIDSSKIRPMISRLLPRNFRAMSTASNPTKHRFFVYAPDKTEEGTLARRLSVRPKHIEGAKAGHESGFIRTWGFLLYWKKYTHFFSLNYRYWRDVHNTRLCNKPRGA